MSRKRVLLGQLNSNGDCLFATVVARQIKQVDYPNCHLTWAVNSRSRQSIELNPYVDEIWEIPTEKSLTSEEEWAAFVSEAEKRKTEGDFDHIFFTQIIGDNVMNYDGGIRSSIYNCYPHKITVSPQPIIRLSENEVENVKRFAEKHHLKRYEQVVLVECGPDSFDVSLNPQSAYQLALDVSAERMDVAFILSSNKKIASLQPNIIDGSELSFRENAELSKYCDLFIGCGSGISWLITSDGAKQLDKILIIKENNGAFPSMIYDHKHINLPTDHIIEIADNEDSLSKVKRCLEIIQRSGFAEAKKDMSAELKVTNHYYLIQQLESTLLKMQFGKAFSFLKKYIGRNGAGIIYSRHFWYIARHFGSVLKNKVLGKA